MMKAMLSYTCSDSLSKPTLFSLNGACQSEDSLEPENSALLYEERGRMMLHANEESNANDDDGFPYQANKLTFQIEAFSPPSLCSTPAYDPDFLPVSRFTCCRSRCITTHRPPFPLNRLTILPENVDSCNPLNWPKVPSMGRVRRASALALASVDSSSNPTVEYCCPGDTCSVSSLWRESTPCRSMSSPNNALPHLLGSVRDVCDATQDGSDVGAVNDGDEEEEYAATCVLRPCVRVISNSNSCCKGQCSAGPKQQHEHTHIMALVLSLLFLALSILVIAAIWGASTCMRIGTVGWKRLVWKPTRSAHCCGQARDSHTLRTQPSSV